MGEKIEILLEKMLEIVSPKNINNCIYDMPRKRKKGLGLSSRGQ
jgi:hypothetical protein